jgi:quercetin dioxygenase-like cupin family protein
MRGSTASSTLPIVVIVAALVCGAARAADDLDSTRADPAHHKLEFENDQVRVVRYVIPPGETALLHSHPALVNVFFTTGELKATAQDGSTSDIHAKAGTASWRGPTVHSVANVGSTPLEGVLVEPKERPDPGWTAPPRDAVKVTTTDRLEFENDRVRIVRYSIPAGETTPMHDHPAGVQILLTDARARQTTPDGKSAEISGKARLVRYRPALSHAVENTGAGFEGILVDLK